MQYPQREHKRETFLAVVLVAVFAAFATLTAVGLFVLQREGEERAAEDRAAYSIRAWIAAGAMP